MTAIPHVITGAAVGSLSPNLGVAVAGGLLSHFVLDLIPHWDPLFGKKGKRPGRKKALFLILLCVDLAVAAGVLYLVRHDPKMFFGGMAGPLPDVDNLLQYKFKSFPILSKIGITIHEDNSFWHGKTTFIKAVFTQGIVTLAGLYLIYLKLAGG